MPKIALLFGTKIAIKYIEHWDPVGLRRPEALITYSIIVTPLTAIKLSSLAKFAALKCLFGYANVLSNLVPPLFVIVPFTSTGLATVGRETNCKLFVFLNFDWV